MVRQLPQHHHLVCVSACHFDVCVCVLNSRYLAAFPNIMGIEADGFVKYKELLQVLPLCSIDYKVRRRLVRNPPPRRTGLDTAVG